MLFDDAIREENDNVAHTLDEEAYYDPLMDAIYEPDADVECEFRTGAAGTGKTYGLRKEIEEDAKAGILCATTGVAAVNLGTVTLNSVLKYFDTQSLTDKYVTGRLMRDLLLLMPQTHSLMIDEISMMDGEQLDIIYQATKEANQRSKRKLALKLVGDFCQLPPVKAKWAFQAQNWDKFAANTTKLEKIWRQEAGEFLTALNLARAGKGVEASEVLRPITKWRAAVDTNFDGTTLYAKNDEVDKHNFVRYAKLEGKEYVLASRRWGKQRGEWTKLIPPMMKLKKGAYVMILTNAPYVPGQPLEYANGDCGEVTDVNAANGTVFVKLKRNGDVVMVPMLTRYNESKEAPPQGVAIWQGLGQHRGEPYYDSKKKRWIYGTITYCPLRLAYATTVHKSQGLTLDKVQVDIRNHFFGSPSMAYVALSRCRTAEGLSVIGSPELLARRIVVPKEVEEWI